MRKSVRRLAVTAVETAIVLPSVLLFMYGIFEYGRYLMVLNVAENAAREGARYAVIQPSAGRTAAQISATTSDILAVTRARMGVLDSQLSLTYTVTALDPVTYNDAGAWNTARAFDPIAVRIQGTYRPAVTTFIRLPASLPVYAQATMGSEAN
jgi:Flp pilus assembly protein TadG